MIWIHRSLWAGTALVMLMIVPIIKGQHDIDIRDAEANTTREILYQLPISALGSIRVKDKNT